MPPSAGSSSVAEYSRRRHAGSSDEYAESRETHIGIHTGRLARALGMMSASRQGIRIS